MWLTIKNKGSAIFIHVAKNNLVVLKELSIGMSADYMKAINYKATYLRLGSSIFGEKDQKIFTFVLFVILIIFFNSFLATATHP